MNYGNLEPTPDEMSKLLDEIGRRVKEFISGLDDAPSHSTDDAHRVAELLEEECPENGCDLNSLLSTLFGDVVPCALNTAGPGYLAYVPGGGLFSAALADLISGIVNRYSTVWVAAPGAVQVESQAIRWLASALGFSASASGVCTTGGSMSNLLAVVAAREKYLTDITKGRVYVSTEAHYSIAKAARVAGISGENICRLPVDSRHRMRVDALRDAIAEDRSAGYQPFFVAASAGTVNTGSIDPLDELADLAAAEELWYHVDGAYGAAFGLVPELLEKFRGMERADSLAVDPHKGMFLAYGTGLLIVRSRDDLREAFADHADYLPELGDEDHWSFFEMSPELSRDWRGLRLWLPIKLHGLSAFRDALREKRALAIRLYEAVNDLEDVETTGEPDLSLFAFRRRHPGIDLDEENRRNRALLDRINEPRRVYMTGTEIDGKFFARACVLHLRTHENRIDEAISILRNAWDAQ